MKKLASVLLAGLLALSLVGCATHSGGMAKVKCPACGYEFEAPAARP